MNVNELSTKKTGLHFLRSIEYLLPRCARRDPEENEAGGR